MARRTARRGFLLMISLSIRLFRPASRDSSCSGEKRPGNADWRPLANAAEKSLNVQFADNPAGGDGKRYADLRDLPVGGNCSGSFGNWPVIASDLEVDPRTAI